MDKTTRARLIKMQQMQTRNIIAKHLIVYVAHLVDGTLVYTNDGTPQPISTVLAKSFGKTQIKWSVTCYVLLRDNQRRNYLKSFIASVKAPCKHSQISEQIADLQWNFIEKECNPYHLLTAGYIATQEGNEPSDEVADKIFTHMGAWNEFIACWEEEEEKRA
ncbi:hypothetical protein MM188_003191 [Vibrio cholerae]|nr:hypothetical protein [Vibrio cholerae]